MSTDRVKAPERLKFVLRKLEDMQYTEAAALSGATALSEVPSELRSLQKMLGKVFCVLMDAQANWEDIQHTDPNVKNCLSELDGAVQFIEKAILNFLEKGFEPDYFPNNFKKISPKAVNFFALYFFKTDIRKVKPQVEMINIEDLIASRDRAITQPARQSHQNVDDICHPGLQIHHKCILQRLVDPSLETRTVVLVGSDHVFVNKALAEKIYQSTEVKNHFEACFWLFPQILYDSTYHGSEELHTYLFRPIDILRKMLLKLGDTSLLDAHDEDYLKSRLRQSLIRKRCLVIVDNNWKELRTIINGVLPDGNNGSRLLITTGKIEQVSDYKYEVPFLYNPADSLKLLKELGQKDFRELEDDIRTLLNQIYTKLPSALKTCIVYTAAVFPCGSVVLADLLIRLWIVEGIIPHEEGTTMENIAESYLEQLVQRGSLRIFRAYYHNQANQPIRSIMLHPSLHLIINSAGCKYMSYSNAHTFDENELLPVAVIRSVDELYYKVNNRSCLRRNLENLRGLALHLPYKFNQIYSFEEGPNMQSFDLPSLHSLFFFHNVAPVASPSFTFVRVLAVLSSHISFPEEYTPCWLDELINLRYLGFIVCLVEGGSLGKTLDGLGKLEILDLSESFVSGLSDFIKNNKKVNVVGPVKEELPESWSPLPDMFQ